MNKTRSILTFILVILIGIIALLAIFWIFGLINGDVMQSEVVKWLGAATVAALAGLTIALLEDGSTQKGKK